MWDMAKELALGQVFRGFPISIFPPVMHIYHTDRLLGHSASYIKVTWADLLSTGILRSVDQYFVTDVSGQTVGRIFKVKHSKKKMGPIGSPGKSVTNYQSTLRNIPEERRSHLHREEGRA